MIPHETHGSPRTRSPSECPGCGILLPAVWPPTSKGSVACVFTGEKTSRPPSFRPSWCPLFETKERRGKPK